MKTQIIEGKIERLTPEEGMVLTAWRDGDLVEHYAGLTSVDGPVGFDRQGYREIPAPEHEALSAAREAAADRSQTV